MNSYELWFASCPAATPLAAGCGESQQARAQRRRNRRELALAACLAHRAWLRLQAEARPEHGRHWEHVIELNEKCVAGFVLKMAPTYVEAVFKKVSRA